VLVVYTEAQRRHHPGFFIARGRVNPCPEVPERAERLLAAVRRAGHRVVAPEDHGPEPRAAVHTARYLAFLEGAHRRWSELPDASPEIVPNVHPGPCMDAYPEGVVGQAGWHQADTACPIGAHTFEAACAAADCAVHAAELVLGGEPCAYALCRPPGHHAYADRAGGFCFLNNSAIAAERLVRRTGGGRVAVLDVDVHHGNGTQGIFWDRGDVLTVSIHGKPGAFYPFFCGYADERGEGAGEGANLNLPLPAGTGDDGYMTALDEALAAVRAFRPAALVVALGLDAFHGDPLAFLRVTTPGFAEIGRRIAGLGLPTVIVQEGGYVSDALGDNLASFLGGFEAGR
jgi:acetoin utilization deacetylase AcuC-like enzyme